MKRDDDSTTQALKLLMQDHRRIRKLIRRAEKVRGDAQALADAVKTACREIADHAALEETHFYPRLRAASRHADVLRAQVEHDVASQLAAELAAMDRDDERFLPTFRVLGAHVQHHIDEEEGQLFARTAKARIDLTALVGAMLERQRSGALADVDFESAPLAGDDEAQRATVRGIRDPQRVREPGRRGAH